MLSELVETWRLADARLFSADVESGRYPHVDVGTALDHALDELRVETDDPDGYAIPLFEPNTPKPTSEYVVYRPDRGQVGWHDASFGVSGTERFTDAEELATTEIGHRLRFWTPENRPGIVTTVEIDDLPPRQVDPLDSLAEADAAAFFDDVREFVRNERDRERAANRAAYEQRDPHARRHSRDTVGPFVQAGAVRRGDERRGSGGAAGAGASSAREPADGASYRYRLADAAPEHVDLRGDHGLFERNWCLADAEDDAFPIPVRLASVDDPAVTLHPDWTAVADEDEERVRSLLADGERLWLSELLNPVPFERRLDAIEAVREHEEKHAILTGSRPVAFSANRYNLPESDVDLDPHQHDALVWADSADDVACIHGPPGTGKTRTLTALVQCAVEKGQTVLVTAHSNQAVDNLLVRESTPGNPESDTLHEFAQRGDCSIARVGRNSRNRVVTEEYVGNSVATADVVAATTSGAAQFETDRFDVAVVDEATQASRPATLIAFDCAEKLVLAGDHRQLPPYSADETAGAERLRPSLFETLLNRYGEEIAVLLRRQYRMHETIASFPNDAFYGGKLETADRNREWTVSDLPPLRGIDVTGPERQRRDFSYANEAEAAVVAEEVSRLVEESADGARPDETALDHGEIGVITPYTAQKAEIERTLAETDGVDAGRIDVDTVDSFQGSERAAVVVSFVRSNDEARSGFLAFPEEGPRRLNVALTRARARLVLVGDWETLGTVAPHRDAEESCADVYAALAERLRDAGLMRSRE
jgi:hypothetical protein